MQNKRTLLTISYGVIAVAVFALLFWLTYPSVDDKTINGDYQIVAFGDSVLGLYRGEDSVVSFLQQKTGKNVLNAAFGGSCMAMEKGLKQDYPRESLSMVGLAKAIYAKDFGVQQSVIWRESNMEYFAQTIDILETVDFTRVETVIIQHGVNDYHAGLKIESERNAKSEYTYKGALRSCIERLREVNPDINILLVTPSFTWYEDKGTTCLEQDFGGGTLDKYIAAQKEVAKEYGITVVDVFEGTYPHDSWEHKHTYMEDGVHPNAVAREMIAQKIAEAMQK